MVFVGCNLLIISVVGGLVWYRFGGFFGLGLVLVEFGSVDGCWWVVISCVG